MATLLCSRMDAVSPSATKAVSARARELRAAGRDVLTLSLGEPDFDTPENIREAGIAAIREGRTRYTAVAGVAELREAIAAKLKRDYGVDYGPEAITVGCGAKQVIFNAMLATVGAGDEVIVPAPCWVSYPDMVHLAGGSPVIVDCGKNGSFKLRPEALEEAITRRTKWLILNSPCNPTGAVYGVDDLRALAEVLRRHPRICILADDIYEKLIYPPARFASLAAVAPDLAGRILIVNGVSKAQAMTGWRVGYGAGPLDLVKAMNVIQGQTTSHTSSIAQYAAIEAMVGDQGYIPRFTDAFLERRDVVVDKLNQAEGLHCRRPDGAFYVFPSCAGVIGKRTPDGRTIETDGDFAMYLLEKFGVAVVPGAAFLASPYVRISYAAAPDQLERACNRIIAACAALT